MFTVWLLQHDGTAAEMLLLATTSASQLIDMSHGEASATKSSQYSLVCVRSTRDTACAGSLSPLACPQPTTRRRHVEVIIMEFLV